MIRKIWRHFLAPLLPLCVGMRLVQSVPPGFLAAAPGIPGWLGHDWTWWFPPLMFSPFIADAGAAP